MRLLILVTILLGISSLGKGLSVFFIGNSYTYYNDLPNIVHKLAKADSMHLEIDSHTEGGWSWEKHASSQETLDKLSSQVWDVVVLQEQSTRPAYPEDIICTDTMPYLHQLEEHIRARSPQAHLQFYLTWGRAFGLSSQCSTYPEFCDYSSMQDQLTSSYTTFACMTKPAKVAPVGEAFRLMKELYGDEEFYKLYNTGGVSDHHPSLGGSYLSGLIHYLALFPHKDVVGNTETMGLDSDYATLLQEVAMATWTGFGEGH